MRSTRVYFSNVNKKKKIEKVDISGDYFLDCYKIENKKKKYFKI